MYVHIHGSRSSDVGIDTATRLWAGRYGVRLSLILNDQTGHGGPPRLQFNGYWHYFPGIKRSGREGNHSPPSTAQIKNEWSYTSTLPYMPSWRKQGTFYVDT